jgi:hypothetical protein
MPPRAALLTIFVLQSAASAAPPSPPAYESVVLSEGDIHFDLDPADREEYASLCPRNICTCKSDIQYLRLLLPSHSIARDSINRQLKSHASDCHYLDAVASLEQEVTHLSTRVVSVVERSYSQQLGTGGSCHGSSAVHTFDLNTGKEYRLEDIIDKASLGSLRKTLPDSIVTERNRRMNDDSVEPHEDFQRDLKVAREALESIGDSQLMESTFFVENERVFIDVAGYYFGCVGGIFHPAEIPASQITPSMRHELIRNLDQPARSTSFMSRA